MLAQSCTECGTPEGLPAVLNTATSATKATAVHRICIAPDVCEDVSCEIQKHHVSSKRPMREVCVTNTWRTQRVSGMGNQRSGESASTVRQ